MSVFCTSCGNGLTTDEKYCANCGKVVPEENISSTEIIEPLGPTNFATSEIESHKRLRFALIFLALGIGFIIPLAFPKLESQHGPIAFILSAIFAALLHNKSKKRLKRNLNFALWFITLFFVQLLGAVIGSIAHDIATGSSEQLDTKQNSTITVKPIQEFKNLSLRDWQFIVKDPDGNKDQFVVVFGEITQFDSGTGLSTFRANVAGQDIFSNGYGGDNSMLKGDLKVLKPFVVGDKFTAKVKILGTYSYTSTFSGEFTVPYLQIYEIKLL
jgi:hypothetical protein